MFYIGGGKFLSVLMSVTSNFALGLITGRGNLERQGAVYDSSNQVGLVSSSRTKQDCNRYIDVMQLYL